MHCGALTDCAKTLIDVSKVFGSLRVITRASPVIHPFVPSPILTAVWLAHQRDDTDTIQEPYTTTSVYVSKVFGSVRVITRASPVIHPFVLSPILTAVWLAHQRDNTDTIQEPYTMTYVYVSKVFGSLRVITRASPVIHPFVLSPILTAVWLAHQRDNTDTIQEPYTMTSVYVSKVFGSLRVITRASPVIHPFVPSPILTAVWLAHQRDNTDTIQEPYTMTSVYVSKVFGSLRVITRASPVIHPFVPSPILTVVRLAH